MTCLTFDRAFINDLSSIDRVVASTKQGKGNVSVLEELKRVITRVGVDIAVKILRVFEDHIVSTCASGNSDIGCCFLIDHSLCTSDGGVRHRHCVCIGSSLELEGVSTSTKVDVITGRGRTWASTRHHDAVAATTRLDGVAYDRTSEEESICTSSTED